MKQIFTITCAVLFLFSLTAFAQIPTATLVQIVRSEDELRYDKTLENLMTNIDAKIRARAALAAGRIGKEAAIPALVEMFQKNDSPEVRRMAMFAVGEIESATATLVLINILKRRDLPNEVRAFALEAAGKIAAANPKDANTKLLGETILKTLDYEDKKRDGTNREVVLLGITAVLRARPEGSENVLIDFLGYSDARMRADALNALTRLRAKNANAEARDLLKNDSDVIVRANAARLLGAAEDKEAFDILLKAAISDADSRVRVSAIRSLAGLKDARAADALMNRAGELLKNFAAMKTSVEYPKEKSEILEIFTTLGRLLTNSNNKTAISLLESFRLPDNFSSPETEIAYARIAPAEYLKNYRNSKQKTNWRTTSALAQGLGELATQADENLKVQARKTLLTYFTELVENVPPAQAAEMNKAIPDLLTALAAFKPDNLDAILREMITTRDVQVRSVAAGILAEQPAAKVNVEALKTAFSKALSTDKLENDAQLAILDALYKLDKSASVGVFLLALNAPDYLIRKKAFQLLEDEELKREFPGIKTALQVTMEEKKDRVLLYTPVFGTKLGMILNSNADYARAVSRKNGTVKAILQTSKGNFTINFFPEDAPLTVDNFIKLARANYFNNVSIHRVVPNFVMQDGDPRGDGNGGPGWQIRDEINTVPYERGAVGMALSGKNTGGSQWFVTHSPQPHLDGGYTVFGRVNETDMKIVDNMVRGDKILKVVILEGNLPRRRKN